MDTSDVWDNNGTLYNGNWPGTQLTSTSTTADEKTWYDWTSTVQPINIIFNSGNEQPKTEDIKGVSGERFYTIDPNNVTENKFDYNDVTAAYIRPASVVYQEGTFAYFEAPAGWDQVYVWPWIWEDETDPNLYEAWPGFEISEVGTAANGNKIYRWTYEDTERVPTHIIFNDGKKEGAIQTANLEFVNGGYYNFNGLVYTVTQPEVTISEAGYAAYSHLEAIDFTKTEGLTAYIINENDGENATLQEVQKVPANTGVVLKGEPGTYTLHQTAEATDDVSANLLKATSFTGAVVTDGTFYVLANKSQGVGFYKLADDNKVKANKAYLIYTASQAKEFIGFAGETTGIHNVNTVVKEDKAVYTLSGVKMNSNGKLPQGVYIINGKKHIIK